jgi:hypothetical protein
MENPFPVEITPALWHYTTFGDALDHWQTIIAGSFALAAGILTVAVTMIIANKQISASRKEADRQITASRNAADRVILATRAQTEATFRQTDTTVRLEMRRDAGEALAFHAMLAAAMTRVLAETAEAKTAIPHIPLTQNSSFQALGVRQSITKGAFAELRAACITQGSPLTGEFLDLEREIDSFALQWEEHIFNAGVLVRWSKHVGLGEQLDLIETKAAEIETKAAELSQKALKAFKSRV